MSLEEVAGHLSELEKLGSSHHSPYYINELIDCVVKRSSSNPKVVLAANELKGRVNGEYGFNYFLSAARFAADNGAQSLARDYLFEAKNFLNGKSGDFEGLREDLTLLAYSNAKRFRQSLKR